MEFWVDGYSAETWWFSLNANDSELIKSVTAYPLRKYLIKVLDPNEAQQIWVTAGIPYRDSKVSFHDGNTIRFIQTGDVLHLDCAQSVKMRVSGKIFPSGSYRWTGDLKMGDAVELLDRQTDTVLHKIECVQVGGP